MILQDDTSMSALSRPQTALRTPAQREASRRNGCKSRGPTTAEGKAKSSQNARKRGPTMTMPLSSEEILEPGKRFNELLAGLKDEFDPQTETELKTVEGLARDYQIRECVERSLDDLINPKIRWSRPEEHSIEMVQLARERRPIYEKMQKSVNARSQFNLLPEEAESVAERIVNFCNEVVENDEDKMPVVVHGDERKTYRGAPGFESEPPYEFCSEKERMLYVKVWSLFRRRRRKMSDKQHLISVLTGEEELATREIAQLKPLIDLYMSNVGPDTLENHCDGESVIHKLKYYGDRQVDLGKMEEMIQMRIRIDKEIRRKIDYLRANERN